MNKKIKAIIFDVGGVLQLGDNSELHHKRIISKGGVHSNVARALRVSFDQYLDSIDSVYAKSIEGKISEEKALKIMAKNLKTTSLRLKQLYSKNYKKTFKLNKQLFNYALKKKKQGYKIAILSDQWWLPKEALITKEFYHFFSPIILSCDVGMRKPDSKIYKLTLKKLKLKPKETIFVDNQLWNIPPARKLGMKTILFKNNKQTIKEIEKILKH